MNMPKRTHLGNSSNTLRMEEVTVGGGSVEATTRLQVDAGCWGWPRGSEEQASLPSDARPSPTKLAAAEF